MRKISTSTRKRIRQTGRTNPGLKPSVSKSRGGHHPKKVDARVKGADAEIEVGNNIDLYLYECVLDPYKESQDADDPAGKLSASDRMIYLNKCTAFVLADKEPTNGTHPCDWGDSEHECKWVLYDADTGDLLYTIDAYSLPLEFREKSKCSLLQKIEESEE